MKFLFVLFALLVSHIEVHAQTETSPVDVSIQDSEIDRASKKQNPPSISDEITPSASAARDEENELPHLTGEWGNARKKLNDQGIDFVAVYKGEVNRVFSGGLRQRTIYLQNLDLKMAVDAEKLFNQKGMSFFLYGLVDVGADNDNSPITNVGDLQGTSSIDAPVDAFTLYEAWLQQIFFEERMSVLLGLHDLNSEFYVTPSSSLFFNNSFGVGKEFSQTGLNGPSVFPTTSLAFRLRVEPNKSFYLQTAVFGALPGDPLHPSATAVNTKPSDGFIMISEAGYYTHPENKNIQGKFSLGTWTYTRTFDHMLDTNVDANGNATPVQTSNYGTYILIDQNFSADKSAFFRYGISSKETSSNKVDSSMSAGFIVKNIFPSRKDDSLGFGIAYVNVNSKFVTQQQRSGMAVPPTETAFEINYRIEAARGLAFQPDLQYVQNPASSDSIADALVGALRIEMGF